MGQIEAHDPRILRHFDGLTFKTAQIVTESCPWVEEEFEDVRQILSIKVFQALMAFDSDRVKVRCALTPVCRCQRCRYVFSCLMNMVKDIKKKKRRGVLFIEDLAPTSAGRLLGRHIPDVAEHRGRCTRDHFEQRYLSESSEQVYGPVEDAPPLVPSTLTELERQVITLLYRDFDRTGRQTLAADQLGIDKREMERVMRSIRQKMADWKPPSAEAPAPVAVAA